MTETLPLVAGVLITAIGLVIVKRSMQPAVETSSVASVDETLGIPDEVDLAHESHSMLLSTTSLFGRVVAPSLRALAIKASHLLPLDRREEANRTLIRAGVRDSIGPEDLYAGQGATAGVGLLVALGATAAAGWSGRGVLLLCVTGALSGWVIPRRWVDKQADARQLEIRRDLPNVIDLMRVTIRAGSSLEAAMSLVVDGRAGPLSVELRRVLLESSLGSSRREALTAFRDRIDAPEVSALVSALIQADELGMPLSRVLEVQADEIRVRRQQWAREQAAKLPVKVLLPLITFIFPPVLVVTLGPAVVSLSASL